MANIIYHNLGYGQNNVNFNSAAIIPIRGEFTGTESYAGATTLTQENGIITSFEASHPLPGASFHWTFSGAFDSYTQGNVTGIDVSQSGHTGAPYPLFSYSGLQLTMNDFFHYVESGEEHALAMWMLRSNDSITGSVSGDTLLGYHGNDTIAGAAAADVSADGGDVILGNLGSDVLYGDGGNDSMVGGSALVDGADGADTIYGGDGSDDIYGSGGNDAIYGEAGNELIVAGADNDTVTGGAGNDIFVHVLGGGYDTILDFRSGEDILTIERTAAVFDIASARQHGIEDVNGSYIDLGNGSGIVLAGVTLASLHDGDFYFYS